MLRINHKYILPLLFIFFITGCSNPLNIVKGSGSFNRDMEQEEKVNEQLRQQYLGMSKEALLAKFGKPMYTDRDCSYNLYLDEVNKKWIKGSADECLSFRFSSGIPLIYGDVWSIMFYLNNNEVVWAKVN